MAQDLERGFLVLNVALVTFGVWCLVWPIRRRWPSAAWLAWGWAALETINGTVHPLWSLRQGGYTPGVATAPFLLILGLVLARRLRDASATLVMTNLTIRPELSRDRERGAYPERTRVRRA